jgi:hypothetical protein
VRALTIRIRKDLRPVIFQRNALQFLLTATCLLLLRSIQAAAQGGPPLVTDDTGTPGDRRWEINVAFVAEQRPGERTFETPLVDANYGWGERIQIKLEIPWIVRSANGDSTRHGVGNALLGVKWRLADQTRSGFAIAIYPQIEVNMVSSSARRGLAEKGTRLLLPLLLEKNLGPLSANVEIGYEVREGEKGRWLGGLALGREVSERIELIAEVFAGASARFESADAVWNAGGRWKIGPRLSFLLSAGTGLHGSPEKPKASLLTYAGSQLLF